MRVKSTDDVRSRKRWFSVLGVTDVGVKCKKW